MKKLNFCFCLCILAFLAIGCKPDIYEKADRYVVVLSMDGFRSDYPARAHTPTLDSLARVGIKAAFRPCYPSVTFSNHYSMATGLHPDHHGLINNSFYDAELDSVFTTNCLDGRFFGGEPIWNTAERQGIRTATYYWVGSEVAQATGQPSIWKKFDKSIPIEARADSVIAWLQLPESVRPHLIMWYWEEPDYTGHFCTPDSAATAYFSAQMNVRRRQLVCDLSKAPVTIQAGAMQWMLGNVNATTGIKGVGDMATKLLRGKASGESAIKPEYTGDGLLVLEPTFKHLLLLDAEDWGGSVVLDDGLFLACDSRLTHKTVMRSNLSSAVAGGEGLFNLSLNGRGVFCLEADCPWEELIEIELKDDVLKVDGNFVIAWSGSLNFTVERSGKSLIGSAASGEGLVNVYRGTGRLLMMPTAR